MSSANSSPFWPAQAGGDKNADAGGGNHVFDHGAKKKMVWRRARVVANEDAGELRLPQASGAVAMG